MHLETIRLNEINHTYEFKCHMVSLLSENIKWIESKIKDTQKWWDRDRSNGKKIKDEGRGSEWKERGWKNWDVLCMCLNSPQGMKLFIPQICSKTNIIMYILKWYTVSVRIVYRSQMKEFSFSSYPRQDVHLRSYYPGYKIWCCY